MDPEDILADLEYRSTISVIGPLISLTKSRQMDDILLTSGLNRTIVIKFGYTSMGVLRSIYHIFKLYRGDKFEGVKILSANIWIGVDQMGVGQRDLSLEDLRQIVYSLFAIFDPDKTVSLEFRRNLLLKKLRTLRFYDNNNGDLTLEGLSRVNNLFLQFTFNLADELDHQAILRTNDARLDPTALDNDDIKIIPADTQRFLDSLEDIAQDINHASEIRQRRIENRPSNRYINPEEDTEIYDLLEEIQNAPQFRKSKDVRGKGIKLLKRLNHHARK